MSVTKGAGAYEWLPKPVQLPSAKVLVACAANLRFASKTIITIKHVHVSSTAIIAYDAPSAKGNKRI